ncbi:hypothetical protein SteCoe_10888 [Stentor coeruleus]|uniref:RING-type domain-containing protein n=1 Tax=Stentor coeruleus TaxID=5963 RepID=A0A1R2CEG0_9CILI|nr:hypothetical protein SteCoe_10888 [Stentor coeruleus]
MDLEDLKKLIDKHPKMEIIEALIAGIVIGTTKLSASLIFRFIAEASSSLTTINQKSDFYSFLLENNLGKAKELISLSKANRTTVIKKKIFYKQEYPCKLCKHSVPDMEIQYLETCADLFHPKCIKNYIELLIDKQIFPLACPECNTEIIEKDISNRIDAEHFQKHQKTGIIIAMGGHLRVLECKNCGTKLEVDSTNTKRIGCPKCRVSYCLNCMLEFHDNQTCDEYKKIASMKKKCPGCSELILIKKKGIQVCKCTAQFCSECLNYSTHCKCLAFKENKSA